MHGATGKVTPDALAALSGASGRNREERARVLGLLDQLRDALLAERAARIEAQAEVERLNGVVVTLTEQNRQLDEMLGMAVQFASDEISESDGMLAEVLAAVQRDVAPVFPARAEAPETHRADADAVVVAPFGDRRGRQVGMRVLA